MLSFQEDNNNLGTTTNINAVVIKGQEPFKRLLLFLTHHAEGSNTPLMIRSPVICQEYFVLLQDRLMFGISQPVSPFVGVSLKICMISCLPPPRRRKSSSTTSNRFCNGYISFWFHFRLCRLYDRLDKNVKTLEFFTIKGWTVSEHFALGIIQIDLQFFGEFYESKFYTLLRFLDTVNLCI